MTTQSAEWSLPAGGALDLGVVGVVGPVGPVGIVAAVALVLVLVAVGSLLRERRRRGEAERLLLTLREEKQALSGRMDELEQALAGLERGGSRADLRGPVAAEYVITRVGETATTVDADDPAVEPQVRIVTKAAFADAVVRESAVQAASLLAGVRRALSPEVRNRVRFEMRQELKRNRRARRHEVRAALREYRARHRAPYPSEEDAA